MRKDLYTSFDAMSNVLMIDLGLLYKVVLCPCSGEGYFGLARRTYSLQYPLEIAAVRLNRFTFRQCDEAIPTRGCRALLRCSTKRSMALPQLPAHALNQLV